MESCCLATCQPSAAFQAVRGRQRELLRFELPLGRNGTRPGSRPLVYLLSQCRRFYRGPKWQCCAVVRREVVFISPVHFNLPQRQTAEWHSSCAGPGPSYQPTLATFSNKALCQECLASRHGQQTSAPRFGKLGRFRATCNSADGPMERA